MKRNGVREPVSFHVDLSTELVAHNPFSNSVEIIRYGLQASIPLCRALTISEHCCYVAAVVAADGLSKRDVFRLPDPFAVITVDAEQTHTTSVMKKTLNPYWNESFDM